jgi:hypothetical protein
MKCLLCDKDFSHYQDSRRYAQFSFHLKKDHSITLESYVLKYTHNDVKPTCGCGCGNETKFEKGKYLKYVGDHVRYCAVPKERKKQISESLLETFKDNYTKIGLTKESLEDYWEKYQSPKYPAYKISEISGHDFRTIKNWWIKLKIASKKTIDSNAKKHQLVYSNLGEKNGCYIKVPEETMDVVIKYLDYIKSEGKTTSYQKIIDLYQLNISSWVLKKRINEFAVNDYSDIFKDSIASKPETEYFDMLSYFVGPNNIKRTYRLGDRYYDACLFDKILVEFDGDFWHPEEDNHPILSVDKILKIKNNDAYKDELAKKHNFVIYRIRESESKDYEKTYVLLKIIQELKDAKEIQTLQAVEY